jgi:hypothetical protein
MEKRKTRSTAKVLRHHIMVVRLTDEERELFERDADRRGLQLSSWARMTLLDKIKRKESV